MSGRLDPDAPTAVLHVLLHAPLLPARRDVAEVRVVQVVRAHHREARVDSAALALVDLVDGGTARGEAMEAEYRASAYHAPDDEYDENWDWSGLMQDLDLYYRLARAMGDTTDWPEWNEGDEFRAVRQASCDASAEGC